MMTAVTLIRGHVGVCELSVSLACAEEKTSRVIKLTSYLSNTKPLQSSRLSTKPPQTDQ